MEGTTVLGRLTWQPADVTSVVAETPRAKTIAFDVPGWAGHRAGQHVDVRLTAEDVRKVSPAFWPIGPGRTLDAVVGALESSEFRRQSQVIVQAWQGAGKMRYEEIAGTNHFTVCDPLTDPQSAMVARIAELAVQVKA